MALKDIVGTAATLASGMSSVGTIVGGLSAVGNLLGIGSSDSVKSQKELAKYQADLEQQQWLDRFNLQNEYNAPEAARKRLQDAGLNENLVYGNLSPNLVAANPHTNNPTSSVSKFMTKSELSQMAAQTSSLMSEASLKMKENESLQQDIDKKEMENEILRESLEDRKSREHYITLDMKRKADLTFEEIETQKELQERYRREYIREDVRVSNWIEFEAKHLELEGKRLGLQAQELQVYSQHVKAMISNLAAQESYTRTLEGGVRISNANNALPFMLGKVFKKDSNGNVIVDEMAMAKDNLDQVLNGMWFDDNNNVYLPYSALFAIQAYNQGQANLENTRSDTKNKNLQPWFNTANIVSDILKTGANMYSQERFAKAMESRGRTSFSEMLRESRAREEYDKRNFLERNRNIERSERGLQPLDYYPDYRK